MWFSFYNARDSLQHIAPTSQQQHITHTFKLGCADLVVNSAWQVFDALRSQRSCIVPICHDCIKDKMNIEFWSQDVHSREQITLMKIKHSETSLTFWSGWISSFHLGMVIHRIFYHGSLALRFINMPCCMGFGLYTHMFFQITYMTLQKPMRHNPKSDLL